MRFGVREICNVVFRAKATQYLGAKKFYKNEPVLYFDTLKTSSLEGAATTVYATGGRGNAQLVAWEGERTLTFTMEDALISPESFAILSGAGLLAASKEEPVYVHTTSQIQVSKKNTITLPETPCWNHQYASTDPLYHKNADIFVMTMTNGQIDSEPCIPVKIDEDGKTLTCFSHAGTIDVGDIVFVDYYVKRTGGAQTIEITADKFGGYYYIEAETLFRDEQSGVDMPAEFVIPKAKVQSNFTFSMASSGDPSTFTFTMDAFPDYTKFKETKKVLAIINVITEAVDDAEDKREACQETEITTKDKDIDAIFDNNGSEKLRKVTVSGDNVNGSNFYDKELFGTINGNATELDIAWPGYISDDETYTIVQQNPSLSAYFSQDPSVDKKTGLKTKTYAGKDILDGYAIVLTDKPGLVSVKLYEGEEVDKDKLIQSVEIANKIAFKKEAAITPPVIGDDEP